MLHYNQKRSDRWYGDLAAVAYGWGKLVQPDSPVVAAIHPPEQFTLESRIRNLDSYDNLLLRSCQSALFN